MNTVIQVDELSKTYPDGTQAVKGISFRVDQGEFFGFLGPNGAGKSTTIKMLITLLAPTGGRALILGRDVTKEAGTVRRLIGYAAQEVGVDNELTGRENLELQGRLYHLGSTALRSRVDELLELVDLKEDAHRPAGSYSGGMRKRLDLATGLIHRPEVLFLDEPTTGLDPQNRAGLWGYLERLNRQEGLTILLTTHYLEEADRLCHRVAIIDHGQIIVNDTPAALKASVGGSLISLAFKDNGTSAGDQLTRATGVIEGVAHISAISERNGQLLLTADKGGHALTHVLRALDEAGIYPDDLTLTTPSLDDVFIKYTGERIRQDAPLQNWRNQRGFGPGRGRGPRP